MKKALFVLVTALLSSAAFAQTKYTQSTDKYCNPGDYICNQVPFSDSVKFNFQDGTQNLHVGDNVTYQSPSGVFYFGHITEIVTSPPVKVGITAPLVFNWAAGGLTGSFNGFVYMSYCCRTARPLLKAIDPFTGVTSTLTVN